MMQIDKKRRAIQYGQFRRLKQEPASKFDWKDHRQADGVPILAREDSNIAKINHRIHTAFDRSIVNNKKSYFIGKQPTIEASNAFINWQKDRKFHTVLSEITEDAVGQGEGFTLLYSPEGTEEAFITKEQSYQCVIISDPDTGRPAYGLLYMFDRKYSTNDESGLNVECYFYDTRTVTKYEGSIFGVKQTEEPKPHLFTGVPLIEWRNNSERISDIEPVLNLMDYYDIMDSDFASELSQLREAYLIIRDAGLADDQRQQDGDIETLTQKLKKAGHFLLSGDNSNVEFVSKDINPEAVKYEKQDLKERIYQMANSYDPVSLSNLSGDVTKYQIEQMLKPLEDSVIETEIWFTESFRYMYELLQNFYSDFGNGFEGDAKITFHRNVPENMKQALIDARAAGYMISQNQLNRLLGLDIDQEENAAELQEEANSIMVGLDAEDQTFRTE
jgi:SPP1 family phage portal protein